MKILVDENIPHVTVNRLRELGHEVVDIRGTPDQGLEDPDLWGMAMRESRMFVTTDKGFTEHRSESHFGILVVRLRQPNRAKIHASVMLALGRFDEPDWPGMLVVVRDSMMSVSRTPLTDMKL